MALTKVRGDGAQGMSLLSTSTALTLDANGHVLKPLQSAFLVQPSTQQANLGNDDTIVFGTEIFDQNGDFASNTFTAPVTGRYLLAFRGRFDDLDTASNWVRADIITSNRDYKSSIFDPGVLASDPEYWSIGQTVLADMDANDTAIVQFGQSSGTLQADLHAGDTFFSGVLIC